MLEQTYKDSRINRNNNMGGYQRLAQELVADKVGEARDFGLGSMSWDEYHTTSYKRTWQDKQIDVTMNFALGTYTITLK